MEPIYPDIDNEELKRRTIGEQIVRLGAAGTHGRRRAGDRGVIMNIPVDGTVCRYCVDDAIHFCVDCEAPICDNHRLIRGECGRCQQQRVAKIHRKLAKAKLRPERIPVRVDWADGMHSTIKLRRASAADLITAIREDIAKKGDRSGFRGAELADDQGVISMAPGVGKLWGKGETQSLQISRLARVAS